MSFTISAQPVGDSWIGFTQFHSERPRVTNFNDVERVDKNTTLVECESGTGSKNVDKCVQDAQIMPSWHGNCRSE